MVTDISDMSHEPIEGNLKMCTDIHEFQTKNCEAVVF